MDKHMTMKKIIRNEIRAAKYDQQMLVLARIRTVGVVLVVLFWVYTIYRGA